MGFMDNVSTFTKGLGEKAKGNYDVLALNNRISQTEREMNAVYLELGRRYFELHRNDPEEGLAGFVKNLANSEASIAELRQAVEDTKAATAAVQLTNPSVRAGGRVCPNCGSPVGDEPFCGVCGTKQEPPAEEQSEPAGVFCPNCGSEIEEDSVFCSVCGTKVK